jgi:hypothetical protein
MNSESDLRAVLKQLSAQRVYGVLQPGNIWVVDRAVQHDEETDAALKTCWMRGWVEPIENAVPTGQLMADGTLPPGNPFQGTQPMWLLTEGGWAVLNRAQLWTLFAIVVSVLSFAVSVGSLISILKPPHP